MTRTKPTATQKHRQNTADIRPKFFQKIDKTRSVKAYERRATPDRIAMNLWKAEKRADDRAIPGVSFPTPKPRAKTGSE